MESTQPSSGPARVSFVQGIPVVEIIGRLDVASAPLLDAQTAPLFTQHRARVLIDMSQTAYISSAGLRSILKMIKLSATGGGRVGLFAVPPQIMEILEISGFQTLMDIYPDRETALKECVTAS
jgi:anti-anti-sigma factor